MTTGRAKAIKNSQPQWVMVGLAWDGPGVLLLASDRLGKAMIDFEARQYDFRDMEDLKRNFNPSLAMTVTIANDQSYIVIAAPTYPEAIQYLFEEWTPGAKPPPEYVQTFNNYLADPTGAAWGIDEDDLSYRPAIEQ